MHVCVTAALPVLQPSRVMAHIHGHSGIILYAHRRGHCVGSIHARRHYRGDTRVGHAGLVQLHLYIHIYKYMRALNISSRALLLSHPLFLLCKTLILHIPPVQLTVTCPVCRSLSLSLSLSLSMCVCVQV